MLICQSLLFFWPLLWFFLRRHLSEKKRTEMFTTVIRCFLEIPEPCFQILYAVDHVVSPSAPFTIHLSWPDSSPPLSFSTCSQVTAALLFLCLRARWWRSHKQPPFAPWYPAKPLVHQNHAHGLFDIFDVLPRKFYLEAVRNVRNRIYNRCGWDLWHWC